MGFSVSGSTVVILIGCLIAFSAAFTVAIDGFDRTTTAQDDRADRLLDRQNTAIEIGNATWNGTTLTVSVTNTGSTVLSIDRTDLLVDGKYVTTDPTVIDATGNVTPETNLWVPGETLAYELESNATSTTTDGTDPLVDDGNITLDDMSDTVTFEPNLEVSRETLESNTTSVKVVTENGVAAAGTVDDASGGV